MRGKILGPNLSLSAPGLWPSQSAPRFHVAKTKMALPTLQPYWMKNYKNRSEGLLVRRTQHEADRREAWDSNAKYFQRSNVEATKQRAWGSKSSYEERSVRIHSSYSDILMPTPLLLFSIKLCIFVGLLGAFGATCCWKRFKIWTMTCS